MGSEIDYMFLSQALKNHYQSVVSGMCKEHGISDEAQPISINGASVTILCPEKDPYVARLIEQIKIIDGMIKDRR